MNIDSPTFTRIESRPARPAWLADAAVPDALVDQIHAHADAGSPVLEALIDWTCTASKLLAELDGHVRGCDLASIDDIDFMLGWWTGTNRIAAAEILLGILGESLEGQGAPDDDKLAERMGELRFGRP